jgi:aminoglycoside phosphotransferase (APT) family kinase protein
MALVGDTAGPQRIEPITERHKIWVYVLVEAGPGGESVIAKRTRTATVDLERRIYEQILGDAPVASLAFYGAAEDPDPGFGWLFLEHAGQDRYSPTDEAHRRSMARWLAGLHAHARRREELADLLPNRGPEHYLARLRSARARIRSRLDDAELPEDHRPLLEGVIARFDGLEAAWRSFEEICGDFPRTLVHGDLSAKNVRVRPAATRLDVVAFDWEMAGWGAPALDLARAELDAQGSLVAPDLETYASAADSAWSRQGARRLRALADVGSIFRVVSLIDWMTWRFVPGMSGRAIAQLTLYDEMLRRVSAERAWELHRTWR